MPHGIGLPGTATKRCSTFEESAGTRKLGMYEAGKPSYRPELTPQTLPALMAKVANAVLPLEQDSGLSV